jgi:hypothetical protein
MRRRAYPYGRYLIREKIVPDVGSELKSFIEKLDFSITKHDEKNEGKGTLIIAVNKKITNLIKQDKPPGNLRVLLSGFSIPSYRDMDPESQRVGIEFYLWPIDEGVLMEMFILPYMEHLDKPEIYGITETKSEEITDWFLCEQVWEHIEPMIVANFNADPVHRRA